MKTPNDFQFSQSSLQDYVNCPRRFELRYLRQLKWPAPLSEPFLEFEQSQAMGQLFHRLVHQYILEIPINQIPPSNSSPKLNQWWETFLGSFSKNKLPSKLYPEHRISAPINGFRIMGQFDLLAIDPGEKAIIFDWKTSLKRSPTSRLLRLIQTRLYPILLIEGGRGLNNGEKLSPDQIEMIYWFTEFPREPEGIFYNEDKYNSDREFINCLILEILHQPEGQFPLTNDDKNCNFCNYRSLCNKGIKPGDWTSDYDDIWDPSQLTSLMDFDQISEVEF